MGNATWGAGHHTGVGEGLALGEEIGRAIGEAVGLKKGVAIGVAASAVVAAAGVGLWKGNPWGLVSKYFSGRDEDLSDMDAKPDAAEGVSIKQDAGEAM